MAHDFQPGDLVLDDDQPDAQWVCRVLSILNASEIYVEAVCRGPAKNFDKFYVSFTRQPYTAPAYRFTRLENPELLEYVLALR